MSKIVNIQPINPINFEYQTYSPQDESLITSFEVTNNFNFSSSYIEYFIYDLNNTILYSNEIGYAGYSFQGNNTLTIDPQIDLETQGYTEGQYYTVYNFLNPLLSSSVLNRYYIDQISSDRTEIRLNTTQIPNIDVVSSSLDLQTQISQSFGGYKDFYLDFGSNQLIIANNVLLDNSNLNDPTVLIKLYDPLPLDFSLQSQCWVVETIATPLAYQIEITQVFQPLDEFIQLRGPNTNLNVKDQINNSTDYVNYSSLKATTSVNNSSSLKYQLNSLLAEKGIQINIDYNKFNNFCNFSSAQTRLENFYYKLVLIEQYSVSSSYSNTTGSLSYYTSGSQTIWDNKINDIITNFDGYEYFLYFDSGSNSWPKYNSTPPYNNLPTTNNTASEAYIWLNTKLIEAEEYDLENSNNLIYSIPSYLLDDPANAQYELFIEMIGQYFDDIWVYIKDVTNKYNADNRLNYGVSKDLVAQILRDLGVKIYQNNFSVNNLYTAFLGLTNSGSLYNIPNITSTLPAPTGLEYINLIVTASNTASLVGTDDVNKETYKRIYHNLPFLLKKKGSYEGLRALITTYGIPETILSISEYGGKDKNPNTWDYFKQIYNYALYTSGSSYVSSSFTLNSNWNATNNHPSSIEFRFKNPTYATISGSSITLPYNTASIASVPLWSTNDGVNIKLRYTGSGYTTSSLISSSADPVNPYNQYALLDFIPNQAAPSTSASVYLPFYDGGWWSVLVNKVGNNYTLYATNNIYQGFEGNTIGFESSSSITSAATSWNTSTTSYFGISSSLSGKIFTGSFQEIRYYTSPLSESAFNNYVMNPQSIDANGTNTAPDTLAFRATLGGELYTSSISIHPKVTGSWILTSSFASNSNFYTSSGTIYASNTEYAYYNQPAVGIQNPITDKIKAVSMIMPTGSTLSPYISIQQNPPVSQSYTRDIDYVEVAFSPQDEINIDIYDQLGYFNIGEYIGDPRLIPTREESYPPLNDLRDAYFEKYTSNYNEWDYIRLIKFFDNSLFKMLQDWVPARTSLAAGIVVKQHVLERNKYPLPQANITSSIAFVGSGSTNIPYLTENILVTGSSVQMGYIEGGEGGSIRNSETLIYPSNRVLNYFVSASYSNENVFNAGTEYNLDTTYTEFSDALGYFNPTTGIYTAGSEFEVPITFIISASITGSGGFTGYDYINLYSNAGAGNTLVAVGTSSLLSPSSMITNATLNFSYTTTPIQNQTFYLTFSPNVDSLLDFQLKVTQSASPTTSSIFTIASTNTLTFNLGLTGPIRIISNISSSQESISSAIINFYNGINISSELIYTTSSLPLNYTLNETFNITSGYLTIENDSDNANITFSNFVIYSEPDYYTINVTPVGDFEQLVTNEFDYNGELEGTNLEVTDGNLNGNNTFLQYPKTPTNYASTLYNSNTVSVGTFLLNTTIPGQGEIYLFYDTGSILFPAD
jgi:hypothetical protein